GEPLLAEGVILNPAELLFEKIDDAQIEAQLEKLAATKRENEKKGYQAAVQKPEISFDDFSRMDIRTGTILEAVKVAKSTKLIQMKVDTGIDIRTIVSGIAEYFQPEELPGKQVSVLVNLSPRKIKNIESQGMILLSEDHDGRLVFVVPEEKVVNGGAIK
ncbi:MAG: methionine--tRNA ligase, partial [Bacteroidales bacterium]